VSVRIIHVSDTHLSPHRAYAQHNWDRFLEWIAIEQPDLVVHTGDVVLDSPDDETDRLFGRRQLHRVPGPWLAVPGNHDIGDSSPDPWMGETVTAERMQAYLSSFRFDSWVRQLGRWTLIGLNAQLLGSGLREEAIQWDTLQEGLATAAGGPCALFLHKPVFVEEPNETGDRDEAILERGRERLFEVTDGLITAIFSGHLHVYRQFVQSGVTYVWAPTTALISEEELGPSHRGDLTNGCVDCELFDDGSLRATLVVPPRFRPVDYSGVPPDVPRGSRFLPPLPLDDVIA
jgi:3',5'-cyclic AMP phosphodiesterase CpdA